MPGRSARWYWYRESEAGHREETFSSAYCSIATDLTMDWKQGFLQRRSPNAGGGLGKRMYTCDTKHDSENDVNNSLTSPA